MSELALSILLVERLMLIREIVGTEISAISMWDTQEVYHQSLLHIPAVSL